jgi:chitin disaccharide deacetylase
MPLEPPHAFDSAASAGSRYLVIHADDFGMSHSVNRATAAAFESHWITSASIMVPCPWFPEAARFAVEHPEACLGVHLTLNSEWTRFRWGPVAPRGKVESLVDDQGYFPALESEVVDKARITEVETELRAQIDKAKRAGIAITHLDSHMLSLLGSPGLFSTYLALGESYGVPCRLGEMPTFFDGKPEDTSSLLDGTCEIGLGVPAAEWLEEYKKLLAPLSPGVHQLTVHLGFDDEEMRAATKDQPAWGAAWRQRDFDVVGSAAFQRFLKDEGFILVSWRDLARAPGSQMRMT